MDSVWPSNRDSLTGEPGSTRRRSKQEPPTSHQLRLGQSLKRQWVASLQPLLLLTSLVSLAAVQPAHGQYQPPLPPLPPGPPPPHRQVVVPGGESWRQSQQVVTQIVLPNEGLQPTRGYNESAIDLRNSYVIDNKRFVESVSSRCMASTILEDPYAYEPSFVIIKPNAEIRLNATVPAEAIKSAGFDPRKQTTILVHGFTQSYPDTTWLRRTRALHEMNTLVDRFNLIIMDWGVASHGTYAQAAAMVSAMGSFLANFIMKLGHLGADRMSIRIVGHSLGAHLAGFAGKRLRPRIGRITALDPAGPCFGKLFSNSPSDRLSPDDAFEVDVYHYDDDFLGLPGQHGQFDVYVNGGSSQPGCVDNVNAMVQALITMIFRRNRVLSESHTRSTEVSTAQLAPTGCQMVAYECRDYAAFTQGECGSCDQHNSQCFLMNFEFQYNNIQQLPLRTSFPGKRLYISTGDTTELFCTNHYQIAVRFEASNELALHAKRNKWRLTLELQNDRQERLNITMTNQMRHVITYLLLAGSAPMRIKAARLQARASDGSLVPLAAEPGKVIGHKPTFKVHGIDINFMSNINPHIRRTMSSRLCPIGSSAGRQPFDYMNAIDDSSKSDDWILFDECLTPW